MTAGLTIRRHLTGFFASIFIKRRGRCGRKIYKIDIDNENVEVLSDISMLKKYIDDEKEHFIIGGATIYRLLMPYASKMYVTLIHQEFEGDAYFPEINEEDWKVVSKEKGLRDENNPFDYEYINFERK